MEGLKLVIGGDVTQAIEAQKTLVKEVEKGAGKIDSTYKKTFTSVSSSIKTVVPATRPAIQAVSKLGDSIETLRGKLLAKQSFLVTETDIRKVAVLNAEIRQLQNEIIRVGKAGKVGFDGLGNAVAKTGSAFGGMASGAQKGFSALRTLANIIPGIGIGGLVALAANAVAGLFSIGGAAEEATKKLKELIVPIEDLRDDAAAGTQEELSKVTALSNAVLDQTNSYSERNNALNQLKKINESYFGDLTLEAAKLGILKDRVDEYTKAIINQAVIKAFSDNIGKVAVELSKQEKAFNDLGKEVDKYKKKVTDAGKAEQSVKGAPVLIVSSPKANLELQKATKNFQEQGSVVGKLRDQMAELRTAIQGAVDLSLEFRPLEVDKGKKLKEGADDTQKFINKAKKLAEELEKLGFIKPADITIFDNLEQQLTKAKKIFADFNSNNLLLDTKKLAIAFPVTFSEPKPEQIKQELSRIQQIIQSGVVQFPAIEIPVEISPELSANAALLRDPIVKAFEDIGKNLPAIDLEMPAGFNRNVFVDTLRKFFSAGQGVTEEGLKNLAAEFKKGIDNINGIIKSLAVQGISSFAEAFGTALAGGDLRGIFTGFVNILADGLSAIGKQMIALAPVITGLKAALKSLNPAILLPAGVALVAIGAALRATVGKGVTGFAQGGLVFGPTMGLVGEGIGTSRSNPEVIAPLDKLKGMLEGMGGANVQRVIVTGRLRGKDQILQNARTNRSQRRLGG